MKFPWLLLLAVALAVDAFVVALGVGLAAGGLSRRQEIRLAFHFGLFQFMMPVLGWAAGRSIAPLIQEFDHWVAFALLAFIGGRMVVEGMGRGKEKSFRERDATRGAGLVLLSVATSLDALAAGLSFAALGVRVLPPALLIGGVTMGLSYAGARYGPRLGRALGRGSEIFGGMVLIGIGIKILLEHL